MQDQVHDLLTALNPLTESARIEARRHAGELVKERHGPRPQRDQFRNHTITRYPQWVILLVVALSVLVLLTAFLLSAMRLYHIGQSTFYETLPDATSATVAGYAVVLLSEAAAVLFTIALSVIGQSASQRRILLLSVFASAALALSGNYYIALDGQAVTVFAVLEAMLPPLLTLSTAWILKELLLDAIQRRHADQVAYELVLEEWKAATADPESQADFEAMYYVALKERLRAANGIGSGAGSKARQQLMDDMPDGAWRYLVARELRSEQWFAGIEDVVLEREAVDLRPLSEPSAMPARVNGNGSRR